MSIVFGPLKRYEQPLRDLMFEYPDTLEEYWIGGHLAWLALKRDTSISLSIHSKLFPNSRNFRVMWVTYVDRKKKDGTFKTVSIIRSRSFGSAQKALAFMETF